MDDSTVVPSNVSEAIRDLKLRIHAVDQDREHYKLLGERADVAFADHRRELTQLLQKERAIFAASEDKLRVEVQRTLQETANLLEKLESQRDERNRELKTRLQAIREEREAEAQRLEAEIATLREELHSHKNTVRVTEEEQHQTLIEQKEELAQQARLHEALKYAKMGLSRRAASSQPLSLLSHSTSTMPALTFARDGSHKTAASSPERVFVPAGPIEALDRCRCRRTSRRSRSGGVGSQDKAGACTSHNVQAMLSTVERRNYQRPRVYLQRHGMDADYARSPFRHRLQEMRAVEEAIEEERWLEIEALRGRRRGSREPPAMPPLTRMPEDGSMRASADAERQKSSEHVSAKYPSVPYLFLDGLPRNGGTTKVSAHGGISSDSSGGSAGDRNGVAAAAASRRTGKRVVLSTDSLGPSHNGDASQPFSSLHDIGRKTVVAAPRTDTYTDDLKGTSALETACRAILQELVELRRAYLECRDRLRDPREDSVSASQHMRQLIEVMERKMEQIRLLRRQQAKYGRELRVYDMMQQILKENKECGRVYMDLLHLVRSA